MPGGFFGVDVFFVISGFLISGIIFRGLADGSFSWVSFYDKRIRRILPNLFLLLICVLVAGWYLLWPMDFSLLAKNVFASGFFYENFQLLKEAQNYFNTDAATKPLLHLWSLAIEEQFYIFFPVLCLLMWRVIGRATALGWFVAAFTVASLAAFLLLPNRTWVFYFPLTRFWELGAGILLSFAETFYPHRQTVSVGMRHGMSVVGLALLLGLYFSSDAAALHPGMISVVAVAGAVLFIAARPDAIVNRTLLSWRLMTFVGLISYSLYLWHWPLLTFLNISVIDTAPWMRLGMLAVSFVVATGVYFFVENPVRRMPAPAVPWEEFQKALKGRWHRFFARPLFPVLSRQPSLWLLTIVFGLNCSAAVIRLLPPHLISMPYTVPTQLYFTREPKLFDPVDFHPFTAEDGTEFLRVAGDARPDLILAGDSHMEMYLRRGVKLARETGVSFENNAVSSCFIFGERQSIVESDECREDRRQFGKLLTSGAVKNVAIAQKWGGDLHTDPDVFHAKLRDFAAFLDRHPGVRVWILLDPPWEEKPDAKTAEGDYAPWKHVTRFTASGVKEIPFRYPHDKRWIDGNRAVREILGNRVTYIETEPYICQNGVCNLNYYKDDDHLHPDYTEENAVWIDPIFKTIAAEKEKAVLTR